MATNRNRRGAILVVQVPYVASFTPDLSQGEDLLFDMLCTGNVAVQNPALTDDGKTFTLRFRDDGSGRSITLAGSAFRGSSDTPLIPIAMSPGSTTYLAFKVNALAGKCDQVAPNKGF
jgi:hypothetical protein